MCQQLVCNKHNTLKKLNVTKTLFQAVKETLEKVSSRQSLCGRARHLYTTVSFDCSGRTEASRCRLSAASRRPVASKLCLKHWPIPDGSLSRGMGVTSYLWAGLPLIYTSVAAFVLLFFVLVNKTLKSIFSGMFELVIAQSTDGKQLFKANNNILSS